MKIFNFNTNTNNNLLNFKAKKDNQPPGFSFPDFTTSNPLERLQQDIFQRAKESEAFAPKSKIPTDIEICENLFKELNFTPEDTFLWRISFALSCYFDIASNCGDFMLQYGKQAFDNIALGDISDDAREAATELIDKSLDTPDEILKAAKLYKTINSKKSNSLFFKGTEFLYAYTYLNEQKSEFLNFENIAIQGAYNNLYLDENNNLESYVKFAKDLGLKNEGAFFKKFAHFAPSFNNFEDAEDKFAAFSYIYHTFPVKDIAIGELSKLHPEIQNKTTRQIYSDNCDVIDHLYEENPHDWMFRLNSYFNQTLNQPKFSAQAVNFLMPLGNLKTAKGKIELEELLYSEGFSHNEVNKLLKTSQYRDVDPLDFIINKNSIIDLLINFGNFDEESAQKMYDNFHQTLNVIYDENNPEQTKRLNILLNIVDVFGLKNDKDFYNLQQQIEQVYAKQGKNKKQQINEKPKTQDINEFISLCSYMTDDMIAKYKKDKYFPLKSELIKRKAQFEKVKPEFEKQIATLNAQHIFPSSYDVFVEYEKLSKLYPDARVFVKKLIEIKATQNDKKAQVVQTKTEFLKYFKDEEKLDLFLAKNSFSIDDNNESRAYSKIYLRILNALLANKDEEKAQEYLNKLIANNFLPNIKPSILNFTNKRTDEDLGILFEIILDENYENPSDIYTLINKYKSKDGDISIFLQNFKKYNIDFNTYLKRIENIQKEFENAGIPIVINNDNITKINLNEYGETKISDYKLALLAKEIINPDNEGNFISGLKHSFVNYQTPIGEKAIGREILASQNGRYDEEFSNIIREYGLSKDILFYQNNPDGEIDWQKIIDDNFAKFIKSNDWFNFNGNEKIPNLTLHAKLRLIDRFVLDKKGAKDLNSDETKNEIKNILKTVYTTTPTKIYKSQDEYHSDRFVAFFNYGNNEIKAVFNKNGQMLTIIKR